MQADFRVCMILQAEIRPYSASRIAVSVRSVAFKGLVALMCFTDRGHTRKTYETGVVNLISFCFVN